MVYSAVMRQNARPMNETTQSIVVKIGSSSLAGDGNAIPRLCAQIEKLLQQGHRVTLVSSGSIAFGWRRLGLNRRPTDLPTLQACAAAGQTQLIQAYQRGFDTRVAAQVLLTRGDVERRESYDNACAAMDRLFGLGAVPIINENDTVAVEEIRFGDNDNLAALVCPMVGASLLVLLTDVEGLLNRDGTPLEEVTDLTFATELVQSRVSPGDGSGGMSSKLQAVKTARKSGTATVIAPAYRDRVLLDIAAGQKVGTRFRLVE